MDGLGSANHEHVHHERRKRVAMTSVLISLFAMLRGIVRSRAALHLEILALRHQLHVLQRPRPRRLRLAKADRWLWRGCHTRGAIGERHS
jgi:hypothetical protein